MNTACKYPILNVLALLAAIVLVSLPGCNTAPSDTNTSDYRAVGVLIEDVNRDTTTIQIEVRRGGAILTGATVRLGTLALLFNSAAASTDSIYSSYTQPATLYAGNRTSFTLRNGGSLVDSLGYDIPDTFSLLSRVPATDTLQPPWTLSLDWSGSDNADAYVMATVKASRAYTGMGYSAYAQDQATAGTIPADAFLLPGEGDLDTGKYYVYVYALSDSPDSALAHSELPVPLPGQLADNISRSHLDGRFGAVMVVRRDSIYVATVR